MRNDRSPQQNDCATLAEGLHVQQLYTFRRVYEEGGYAGAAAASAASAPTVWQHVKALERAYGVSLFRKQGRGVLPTAAARRLYQSIDEILVGLESTFALARKADELQHPITLVSGNRMMIEDLAEPLAEFQHGFSGRLVIRHGNNQRAEQLLLAGEADVALSLAAAPDKQSSQIHYEPAYFVDFIAVAPKRHPYIQGAAGSLRELVKHSLIVSEPGTHGRDALEQAIFREGLAAKIVVETDNSGFTIACVHAGMGLGVLAGRAEGRLCRGLATRSLRRQLGRRQIVIMWRQGRRLTDSLRELVATIRAHRA